MGHLDEDARPVPGVDLAAAGAAVQEVLEDGEGLAHDGVGLSPLDVHDEADAAGVVLVSGIVEALRRWHPGGVVDIAVPFSDERPAPSAAGRVKREQPDLKREPTPSANH